MYTLYSFPSFFLSFFLFRPPPPVDSDLLMCHSTSRGSFNALIDDVLPRPGERDVSFLYKSLMRGAVLDVEAAEATCNDALLTNQQNQRKGAHGEPND